VAPAIPCGTGCHSIPRHACLRGNTLDWRRVTSVPRGARRSPREVSLQDIGELYTSYTYSIAARVPNVARVAALRCRDSRTPPVATRGPRQKKISNFALTAITIGRTLTATNRMGAVEKLASVGTDQRRNRTERRNRVLRCDCDWLANGRDASPRANSRRRISGSVRRE